jgi:hypothetical protein
MPVSRLSDACECCARGDLNFDSREVAGRTGVRPRSRRKCVPGVLGNGPPFGW